MAKAKANAAGMAKTNAISFLWLLAAIISISIVEAALAGFGIIPPVLSYSPANLFFAFLRLAIIVYAGLAYVSSGTARAAAMGGALFLASSFTLCLSVFAAKGFATHPILGIFVTADELPALCAIIILENALAGAAITAAVAWLSREKIFKKQFSSI